MKSSLPKKSAHLLNQGSGRLEVILAAINLLPKQKDVPGLLRMVRYCCANALEFSSLCIMIETPLQEEARIYTLESCADSVECGPLRFFSEQGRYAFFRQAEVNYFDEATLTKEFPAVIKLTQFSSAKGCLYVPLPVWVNGYHCALLFWQTTETPIGQEALALGRVLGGIVTGALTKIVQMEEVGLEAEELRRERDRLNILVNVSHVINSTLEIDDMVDMVAMDLTRFFAIKDVVVTLTKDEGQLIYYGAQTTHKLDGRKVPRGVQGGLSGTLFERIRQHNGPIVFNANELKALAKTDQAAAFFLACGNQCALGLPLKFRSEFLGVMFLANDTIDVFTRDTITLLLQIADSVACATHNAKDYASMRTVQRTLAEENRYLSSEIEELRSDSIIGQSKAILHVLQQVEMVAASDSTVLLLGETGTGKEIVAEAIHKLSKRQAKRMIKLNCAAVPSGLLESELFGHEKGAFTGASNQSKGRFELANGSSLLLDEVGDLPLELQPKLLRILQTRELERLGGHDLIEVDVRLIAATNRDLAQMVQEGRFRDDLFYRLNVFPITIPPLRSRPEDIPLLAEHFMQKIARRMGKAIRYIPDASLKFLSEQEWPGNVRELANVIERAVILTTGDTLNIPRDSFVTPKSKPEIAHIPSTTPSMTPKTPPKVDNDDHEISRQEIIDAILACNGLIAGDRGAASMLGMKRTTLLSRMKRLGLNAKDIMAKK